MRPGSTPRLANVERLRLLAMYEIVAFHVSEQRLPIIAGLGLPTFLLLNNAFNCTLSERMGARAFLRTKVARLLVPWLLWSAIYLAMQLLERYRHDESFTEGFTAWMLIGGTYTHLWFVPFSLVGSLLIAGVQARTSHHPHVWAGVVALLAGAVITVVGGQVLATGRVEWPLLQWLFALPAVPMGFGLGRMLLAADPAVRRRLAWVAAAVAVACLGVSLILAAALGPDWEMVRRYAVSLSLVSIGFVWPGHSDAFSQRLAPLLFGVYLSHPLILRVYQATHLPLPPTAIFAALVFGVSALLVLVLQRTPLRTLV
jgi:surface polysaccharide O-acyltransferase-like enzyme